ncbi:Polyprenol monophosphomannose synthase [subsurface metagenome]
MPKKVIIIIPAYNEERNISWVLKKIPNLPDYIVETIVINDGSEDNTALLAAKHGVIVINNKKNIGLGQTIRKGLVEALKRDADIIVNMDADGQYDPEEIRKLIKPFERVERARIDLVLGARLQNIEFKFGLLKSFGNKIISFLISLFISRKSIISDTQTGFRAISKDLVEVLVKKLKGKYTYTQEMIIHAKLNNFRIIEVPIHFYQRRSGKSRLIRNPFIYLYKIVIICAKTFLDYKIKLHA